MWNRRKILSFGAAAALAGCGKKKGTGLNAFAFVANAEGQAVAVVDLSAFAVARHIPLGRDEHPTAVLAPQQSSSVFALSPATGSLHAISVEQLKYQRALRVGQTALKMLPSADGKSVYVLLRSPRKLVRVSLDRFAVEWELPLLGDPSDFDVDASPYRKADTAAVSFRDGTVAFVDVAQKSIRKPLELQSDLGAIRFQSNGEALLVADHGKRSLHVVDSASAKRVVELPLAVRPDHLCFSSDGGQLFVTGEGADVVCVVYHYHTPYVAETVLAGRGPAAMAASTTPGYLFVANPSAGDVSIFNLRDRKMMAVVGVGAEPGYITVTPDSQYALVLNRKSGDMAVLRIGGIQRNRQKSAGLFTMIPVGSSPVSAAVRMI
jgi:DNA-binding beta-propeller fold protein YncE